MPDDEAIERRGPLDLGTDRPHSARMYDYYLGGKDNYGPDRKAAGQALAVWPAALSAARANRAFMHRATHTLAHAGFRQFLDVGTGIPTRPNLHEVAQAVTPEARVVYVDNDPIVLTHARALLTGTAEGKTAFARADVTRPQDILSTPELAEVLDLDEPVALSANAVLHFVPDRNHDAYAITAHLMNALPAGSALCISHVTADIDPEGVNGLVDTYNEKGVDVQARTRKEVESFFDGLEVLDPGIVLAHRWRPEVTLLGDEDTHRIGNISDGEVSLWAGIGIKK